MASQNAAITGSTCPAGATWCQKYYDTAGRRVRKIFNGQTTIWVYDAFGKLAAEYTTETQTTPAGTYYRTTDHLGSTRLVTDDMGRVRQRRDFFPFGEQIPASASFGNRNDVTDGGFATYNASLSMRQQFTGQQRDEETGLDYFWARNMAAPLGRFLSTDPGGAGATAWIPQSWNAYTYVLNNAIGLIDPDGAQAQCPVQVCTIVIVREEDPWGLMFPGLYRPTSTRVYEVDGEDQWEADHAEWLAGQTMPDSRPLCTSEYAVAWGSAFSGADWLIDVGESAGDIRSKLAWNAAMGLAIQQQLLNPFKSPIFRGMVLSSTAVAANTTGWATSVMALYATIKATLVVNDKMNERQCQ